MDDSNAHGTFNLMIFCFHGNVFWSQLLLLGTLVKHRGRIRDSFIHIYINGCKFNID